MNVKIIEVGYLKTNCYILEKDNKCLVIDPGDEFTKIDESIEKNVIAVLVTHRHFDHIGALNELVEKYKVPIYEKTNLSEGNFNIDSFNFEVIFTPGHTSDPVTYYFYEDNMMFTGDFLFHGDTGRTDLETGSDIEMKRSIDKIKKYKDNIIVFPGHEESTTLGDEKKYNISF